MPKLSKKIYFAYGFQEFALGFMTTMGTQYFAFFLTDGALMAPAIVATILLVGRFVDTLDVPFIGMIVQKSNLPWGKYRSWLIIAPPLVVVFNLLMFSNFDLSDGLKSVILGGSYILAYIFVNFTSTARFSMLPTFTDDQDERAKLAAKRGQGAALGQVLRGFIVLPMVLLLGGGNKSAGFVWTVLIFGVVTVLGLWWLAALAKPYDKPVDNKGKKAPSVSVKDMVTQIATNRPLLILMLADVARLSGTFIIMGLGIYFFNTVVGNILLFSIYLPVSFIGGFLGNSVSEYISVKFDKRTTYILGIAVWCAAMLSVYLFAGTSAVMFIAFVTVAQFGNGLCNAAVPAFYSDTADYGEWKTGKSVRAVNMALVIFPIKLGVLIGGSLAAYGLAYVGYVAGTTDPNVISSIRAMIALMPCIAILSIVFMLLYPLKKEKMVDIQKDLSERKAQSAAM